MSLVSLYDAASLWMTPSGAEDGKLFSQLPTDGSGDFTFSRGSNLAATRVGPTGLIEKGRENLLKQSNNFGTTWLTTNASVTSGQSGYDGSSDAWLLDISGGANSQQIRQSVTASGVTSYSIYAKANTLDWILLYVDASQNTRGYFDIANGVLGGANNLIDSKIESVGNGYYRCTIVCSDSITQVRLYLASGDGSIAQSSGSIYIQDAQLEIGLAATDYIESGATTGKAGLLEDEPRFDYSGGATCPSLLLEPSRTTILPYSEYFQGWHSDNLVSYSVNDAISPEGLTNATKVTATSISNAYFRHTTAATAGDNTFSIFAKYEDCQYIMFRVAFFVGGDEGRVWFDIQNGVKAGSDGSVMEYDIEDYGNGWYRCYVVHNVDVGDLNGYNYVYLTNADGSILVDNGTSAHFYGGQWEAGSYPTSYIPNHSGGGSITRGAETNIVEGISSVIGQTEGTLYGEVKFFETSIDSIISLSDGTNNDRILFAKKPDNKYALYVQATTEQVNLKTTGTFALGDYHKFAVTYKANDFKLYVDGTLELSATSGSVPVGMSQLEFYNPSGSSPFNGNAKQILLFPEALTDSECIKLTTL